MTDLKKWPALDFVKFICVAVMIFAHAHIMLIIRYDRVLDNSGFFYKITEKYMPLGLFIMILPMLAGVVFRIAGKLNLQKTANTAIFLALLGFFMNIITWGWRYSFSWNVLQFIGLSFLVIAFLMEYFSIDAVFLLSFITLVAAEPLRGILWDWQNNYFTAIFIGSGNGYMLWPFLPWFGLVGLGFIFADVYEKNTNKNKFIFLSGLLGVFLIIAVVLMGEISPFLDPKYIWGSSVFQPKIGWVFAAIGLFLSLMAITNTFLNKMEFHKYGIVNSFSKGILWIYVVQMFVSHYLSFVIKRFFPMDGPTLAYFILPVFMLVLSWGVGALSIKLLTEKTLVITLKKIR